MGWFDAGDGDFGEGDGFEEEGAEVGAAETASGGDKAAKEEGEVVSACNAVLRKVMDISLNPFHV